MHRLASVKSCFHDTQIDRVDKFKQGCEVILAEVSRLTNENTKLVSNSEMARKEIEHGVLQIQILESNLVVAKADCQAYKAGHDRVVQWVDAKVSAGKFLA